MPLLRTAARAPSNIALVKYMGKKGEGNLPENPSLSMTLDQLCSVAEVTRAESGSGSCWLPEVPQVTPGQLPFTVPRLSEAGIERILRHVARALEASRELLPLHGLELSPVQGRITLRTANTFPPASGIASSASSFAAVTLAVAQACARDPQDFERAWGADLGLRRALARVARQGSGSSCRSFEGPWVLWEGEDARAVPSQLAPLAHFVILVRTEPKKTSSSDAHARVKTSPLWKGRPERAALRTRELERALQAGDLAAIARLAWAEAWEMHSLFHTSDPPFTYWEPGTIEALQWFAPLIEEPRAPIVTLDAGPNLHVLVDRSQAVFWRQRLADRFGEKSLLSDGQGKGAVLA